MTTRFRLGTQACHCEPPPVLHGGHRCQPARCHRTPPVTPGAALYGARDVVRVREAARISEA